MSGWEHLDLLGLPIPRQLVPHQPSERCATNTHCYSHNLDEPDLPGDFRVCGECCHIFRTETELVEATAALIAQINANLPEPAPALPVYVALLLGYDPALPVAPAEPLIAPTSGDQIDSCPHCTHDF